jgi:type IV secretory pathway VirB4 component
VFVDRFALDRRRANAHKLSVAPTGRGKSFEIHNEIVSLLLEGVQVRVVDLENEYLRAAEALGGTVVRLGDSAGINPLELAEAGDPGAVTRQALFVEALVATMLGGIGEDERAAVARAVMDCYQLAGISADPASHGRTPPQLLDLEAALQQAGERALADRLEAWTVGSHAGLLSGQASNRPEADLVVWALGDLPPENDRLQAAAVLAVVHAVWSEIARQDRRRRVVVLDEAWRIWEVSAAAGQVLDGLARRLAKGARKYNAGLTNATQDLGELAATALGRTILNNSAMRWLPGQEEAALRQVAETFGLTEVERTFLAGCPRGQGLFLAGRQRCRLEVRATPIEHRLATSDPDELAAIDAEEIRAGAEAAAAAYVAELAAGEASGSGRAGLACRHRLSELDGDWLAGVASGLLELVWSDGDQRWGELLRVRFVRRGTSWRVEEALRAPELTR